MGWKENKQSMKKGLGLGLGLDIFKKQKDVVRNDPSSSSEHFPPTTPEHFPPTTPEHYPPSSSERFPPERGMARAVNESAGDMDEVVGTTDDVEKPAVKKRFVSKDERSIIEEMMDSQLLRDKDNPYLYANSVEEQADGHPSTFVGNCMYHYLSDAKNYAAVAGDYRIVFARALEGKLSHRMETFPDLSEDRSFRVATQLKQTTQGSKSRDIIQSGYWGAVDIRFNNHRLWFGLGTATGDKQLWTTLHFVEHEQSDQEKEDDTRLHRVLQQGIAMEEPSGVYFGTKYTGKDPNDFERRNTFLGFQVLELELQCNDPDNGKGCTQSIIAVKLDNDGNDISSALLLQQKIVAADISLYQDYRQR